LTVFSTLPANTFGEKTYSIMTKEEITAAEAAKNEDYFARLMRSSGEGIQTPSDDNLEQQPVVILSRTEREEQERARENALPFNERTTWRKRHMYRGWMLGKTAPSVPDMPGMGGRKQ
jgi:hypothetical protein